MRTIYRIENFLLFFASVEKPIKADFLPNGSNRKAQLRTFHNTVEFSNNKKGFHFETTRT